MVIKSCEKTQIKKYNNNINEDDKKNCNFETKTKKMQTCKNKTDNIIDSLYFAMIYVVYKKTGVNNNEV